LPRLSTSMSRICGRSWRDRGRGRRAPCGWRRRTQHRRSGAVRRRYRPKRN
jgi:hypothetical protein